MKLTRTTIILLAAVVLVALLIKFGVKIEGGDIGSEPEIAVSQRADLQHSQFNQDYFSTGNLIVLNVWATWCAPCIAEMPALNQVKRSYEGKKIDFISFSLDMDSIKLAEFLASGKFEFTDITFRNRAYRNAMLNVLRGKNPEERIGSVTVPMTFLLKRTEVLEFVKGTVEREELVKLIDKYTSDT